MRFVESLFFKKKLITTNKDVVFDPFYNKNNVFIYGVDLEDNIKRIVNDVYDDSIIIETLDFEKWIKGF